MNVKILSHYCANIKAYGWHHRLKPCDAQSLAKVVTTLVYHVHRKFQDKFAKGGDVHEEALCSSTEWISLHFCTIYYSQWSTYLSKECESVSNSCKR